MNKDLHVSTNKTPRRCKTQNNLRSKELQINITTKCSCYSFFSREPLRFRDSGGVLSPPQLLLPGAHLALKTSLFHSVPAPIAHTPPQSTPTHSRMHTGAAFQVQIKFCPLDHTRQMGRSHGSWHCQIINVHQHHNRLRILHTWRLMERKSKSNARSGRGYRVWTVKAEQQNWSELIWIQFSSAKEK